MPAARDEKKALYVVPVLDGFDESRGARADLGGVGLLIGVQVHIHGELGFTLIRTSPKIGSLKPFTRTMTTSRSMSRLQGLCRRHVDVAFRRNTPLPEVNLPGIPFDDNPGRPFKVPGIRDGGVYAMKKKYFIRTFVNGLESDILLKYIA